MAEGEQLKYTRRREKIESLLNELQGGEEKRAYQSNPSDIEAKRQYRYRCAELKAKLEAICRKETRYQKRDAVLSVLKADGAGSNSSPLQAAYVELLMEFFRGTPRGCQCWIKDLMSSYGAKKEAGEMLYWDIFQGTWLPKVMMEAAYIFPVSFGEKAMTYIFGSNEWKVLVLDKGLWDQRFGTMTFGELDGKKLAFCKAGQPGASYLYLRYLVAMARHFGIEKEETGVQRSGDCRVTVQELVEAWNSQEIDICEDVLRGFASLLGNDRYFGEDKRKLLLSTHIMPNETDKMVETLEQMGFEEDGDEEDEECEEDEEDEATDDED
ncbi:hypothetical protein AJ79_05716 [Helicocarpus griseus UAMH5409]|uniref:HNH nuclease domain-containing protein n=1 Tax=Helicocarpus griseus UAMH5409 TaxID=1447875 RepID=A0A2B7XKT4_9EURO|nr:hypothetical protein AJ79_05716 [Helicocarpus griseus UAMH5409]